MVQEAILAAEAKAKADTHNISFFAFTATPKAKTMELFGTSDDEGLPRPFHTYTMQQAIEEQFILDVLANYTTYDTYYRLANSAPGGDDPEVPKGKAAATLARFVSLHPTNLAQKAEIIVEHFRQKTAGKIGGRAKAMVVTRSRLHAVRYKHVIDEYKHQAQTITCTCGWHGSSATIDRGGPGDDEVNALVYHNRTWHRLDEHSRLG